MNNQSNFLSQDKVCDHLAQLAKERDEERESFRTLTGIITETELPSFSQRNTHYEDGVLTDGRAKDDYGRGTSAFRNYVCSDSHGTVGTRQVQEILVHDVASVEKGSLYHSHVGYEVSPTGIHEFYNGVNVKAEKFSPNHHLPENKVNTDYEKMSKDPLDSLVHPWRENQGGSANIQRQAREAEKEAQEKAAERQAKFRSFTKDEIKTELKWVDKFKTGELDSNELVKDLAKAGGRNYDSLPTSDKARIEKLAEAKMKSLQKTFLEEKQQQARDAAKAQKAAVWEKLRDEKEKQSKREAQEKAEKDKRLEASRILAREKLEEKQRELQRQTEQRLSEQRMQAERENALKAQREYEAKVRLEEERKSEQERLLREQKAEHEREAERQRQLEREEHERHEKAERERRENELREERERRLEEERLERERFEEERLERERCKEERRLEEEREAEEMQSTCSWYYHSRCLKGHSSCKNCCDYDSSIHSCSNCSYFESCPGSNRKGDSWNGICNAYGGNPIRDNPSSHTCKAWA